MKRCSRCIMPETIPGITFDEEGVCNFCRDYRDEVYRGEAELERIFERIRSENNRYDCIVPLSGGRDSTFILYQAKAVHGLKVLAVSYDNEFRTQGAIDNIENACSRLGVDLISIRSKRDIARKIVRSEIRYGLPLGLSALVQVICHACHYGYRSVVYREAQKHKVPLILWGESQAEATGHMEEAAFQHRGSPAPLRHSEARFLRFLDRDYLTIQFFKLLQRIELHAPGNDVLSPGHPVLKNEKIIEIRYFDYVKWDRKRIKETIKTELGWRKPADHVSSWRTDCLLHPLVNYCYFNEVGCSKACFGYCNMINSGQMTREEAVRQEEALRETVGPDQLEELLSDELNLSEQEISRIRSYGTDDGGHCAGDPDHV